LLIVISGPSGTGKGTVLRLVKESCHNIKFSVSATTRSPREGEVDGVNYFFKTIPQFEEMIRNNEFAEWVKYCDNYYGTPKKWIMDNLENGFDVILEIEVEGALNIKKQFPDCVTIFMLPPNMEELRHRITSRGTEELATIEKRMSKARSEFNFVDKYDYITINNTVEDSVREINSIILAEKLKYDRNKDIIKKIDIKGGSN
jgi:guanylate kinase